MTAAKRQGRSKGNPGSRLKYKPQGPVLSQFHKAEEFVRIIIGPLGSGKTFGAINDMLHRIHTQVPDKGGVRRSRWCVARNSFPDLNSATIPDFRSITDNLPFGDFTMGSPPRWTAKYARSDGTTVETEVMFRSFDGPQDVVKARGMQLTGVWIDELAEFHKDNFDMLIGRVKRYPPKVQVPKAEFHVIASSNACPRDYWLAEYALDHTPQGWWIGLQAPAVTKQGGAWVENPNAENYRNLARGYYQGQIGGKKESWIRQNLANEFVFHSDGRAIHPNFNEVLHTGELKPTYGVEIHVGMDWGRTPAAVIMQRQPSGQWYVFKEIVLINAGADALGREVKRVLNEEFAGLNVAAATGDPSGTAMSQTRDETPFELFDINAGFTSQPANTNDFDIRVAALDDQLATLVSGEPALVVDKSCVTLIRGLAGAYCFRRIQVTGEERFRDVPDKGPASHVCEALHYALMGAGMGDALFDSEWDSEYADVDSWAPDPGHFE